jgi:hypothetical protein
MLKACARTVLFDYPQEMDAQSVLITAETDSPQIFAILSAILEDLVQSKHMTASRRQSLRSIC